MLQLVLGNTDIILSPGAAESVVWGLVKLLFMLAAGMYVIFAVVVVRQVQQMRNTVITPASNLIMGLGFLHLVLAIIVLLYFFVTL